MEEIIHFLGNHMGLTAALIVVTLAVISLEVKLKFSAVRALSPALVTQYINHRQATVVDIRSAEKFEQGHLLGAKNIPKQQLDSRQKELVKKKDKPIILVCDTGQYCQGIGHTLSKKGFPQVYTLQGGLNAWREENLPLDKK